MPRTSYALPVFSSTESTMAATCPSVHAEVCWSNICTACPRAKRGRFPGGEEAEEAGEEEDEVAEKADADGAALRLWLNRARNIEEGERDSFHVAAQQRCSFLIQEKG